MIVDFVTQTLQPRDGSPRREARANIYLRQRWSCVSILFHMLSRVSGTWINAYAELALSPSA